MESEEKIVQVFLGYQVDGIVLTGVTHTPECISLIRRAGTPVVETLDLSPEPVDMVVGFSNFEAGRAITRHLLGRGYRRIAFVGHAASQDTRAAGRQAGFLSAMAEQSDAPPMIVSLPSTSDEQGARAALEQILERAPDTDAILFVGHLLGAAAIRHAHDIGVAVPGSPRDSRHGRFAGQLMDHAVSDHRPLSIARHRHQCGTDAAAPSSRRGAGREHCRPRLFDRGARERLSPGTEITRQSGPALPAGAIPRRRTQCPLRADP